MFVHNTYININLYNLKLKDLLKMYRSQSLQRAKTAYGNYRNDYDNLNSWLSRVPNYEPRETDDIKQIDAKLKNQRVTYIFITIIVLLYYRLYLFTKTMFEMYRFCSLTSQERNQT